MHKIISKCKYDIGASTGHVIPAMGELEVDDKTMMSMLNEPHLIGQFNRGNISHEEILDEEIPAKSKPKNKSRTSGVPSLQRQVKG